MRFMEGKGDESAVSLEQEGPTYIKGLGWLVKTESETPFIERFSRHPL